MNSYSKWRITHLSASSLNKFIASPVFWSVDYLAGIKEGGPSMWRGSAVEAGLLHHLHGRQLQDCHNEAMKRFEQDALGILDEKTSKERANVPEMLDHLIKWWKPPGMLLASQVKISYQLDGCPIPIIGYLDFSFEPFDIDLKTTQALPSKPKPEHVRQVSVYRAARNNKPGGLLYTTGKKHAFYEVTNEMVNESIEEFAIAAKRLERFLSSFNSVEDVLGCFPLDSGSFYWSQTIQSKVDDLLTR